MYSQISILLMNNPEGKGRISIILSNNEVSLNFLISFHIKKHLKHFLQRSVFLFQIFDGAYSQTHASQKD